MPPFFKGRDEQPIQPFHWEIEFPEVFQREGPGFDAFVGNPPFAGKNTLINGNRAGYLDWLKTLHEQSHGNADLVAHFFRRAFDLLRPNGAFGLIATNTIGQGDTRSTGLRWVCTHGGVIYWARKRYRWPGAAAVVVSVVHVHKENPLPAGEGRVRAIKISRHSGMDRRNPDCTDADNPRHPWSLDSGNPCRNDDMKKPELDGRPVDKITAYLFHAGGHDDPKPLKANAGKSFIGSYVLGMGFTFDDTDSKGVASSLADMQRLIGQDPRNAERIFPYIGGEEVNDSPTHAHHRYVINFADYPLRREALMLVPKLPLGNGDSEAPASSAGTRSRSFEGMGSQAGAWEPDEPAFLTWADADDKQREAWLRTGIVPLDYPGPVAADWPTLLEIVERKVKPERLKINDKIGREKWWLFLRTRPEMQEAIHELDQVLVISRVGQHGVFTFLSTSMVYSEQLVVFADDCHTVFGLLQSRIHEAWVRFFGSSMKDDLRYTPSDCFETFPFSLDYESNLDLETLGRAYYAYRAELMVKNHEGLTKTYNRFHDPNETAPEILKLRELHTAMDRARNVSMTLRHQVGLFSV